MTMTMPTRELDRLSRSGLSTSDLENLEEDLAGRPMFDRMGDEIGSVEDELIDPRLLRARFVLVSWGGLLGIGRQQRLVPIEVVERIEPDGVYLGRDRDLVTSAPPYSDQLTEEDAELHYAAIYDLYGVMPYWRQDPVIER